MPILWTLQSELQRHEVVMVRDGLLNKVVCLVIGFIIGYLLTWR